MNKTLKTLLTIGAVVVIPGMGVCMLVKKIFNDINERERFQEYIRKTYGKESKYDHVEH